MRFRFGAGSFARHKRVFLHLNFARSTVARGRQNAHTNDVQKAVGSFHASVTIEDPAEVPPGGGEGGLSGHRTSESFAFKFCRRRSTKFQDRLSTTTY